MDPLYALPCLLLSGFTLNFRFYDHYYIIAAYILPYSLYFIPPVSCPYPIKTWVIPTWYHLLYIYLLLCACAHDTIFNACLWFRFIDARIFIYARHLALASPLAGEFWLPSYPGLRAWSLWILPVADLKGATVVWITDRPSRALSFQPPVLLSSFSSVNSWAPFVLFILIYLLVFSQLHLSVM